MDEHSFVKDIPARHKTLLRQLVGAKIQRFTRYLYDKPAAVPVLYGIPPHRVFSYFSAPVVLQVADGLAMGVDVDTREASLVVWVLRTQDGRINPTASLLPDPTLFPIECTDPDYSTTQIAALIGGVIDSVAVLECEPKNLTHALRARQVGIVLGLRDGRSCILSCGLHNGSDDFSILFREDLNPDWQSKTTETLLLS